MAIHGQPDMSQNCLYLRELNSYVSEQNINAELLSKHSVKYDQGLLGHHLWHQIYTYQYHFVRLIKPSL
jgi:hypothetical protein